MLFPHQLFEPLPSLAHAVRVIFTGHFPDLENHVPATFAGYLNIYLQGGATLTPPDAEESRLPPAFIVGPTMRPTFFRADPGSRFISVNLRAQHMPALLGAAPAAVAEKFIPLEEFIDAGSVDSLLARLRAAPQIAESVAILQDFLHAGLRPVETPLPLPDVHEDDLLRSVEEFARDVGLGPRQFERRFLQQYGLPPRDYRRLGRFLNALAALLTQPPPKGGLTRLAQDYDYFDLAHFARDFRSFVGIAPGKFMERHGRASSVYSAWRFTPDEIQQFMDY